MGVYQQMDIKIKIKNFQLILTMNDTTQYVHDLQLSLWLKKTPMQRLHQFMVDNDEMYKFWKNAKTVTAGNKKMMITKEIIQSNKKLK